MSKKKLLSAALAGGLAATGANAVEIQPAGSNTGTDIIAGVTDDLLLFGGDADDLSLAENLLLGPIIELNDEPAGDLEFDLAQTIYGGSVRSVPTTVTGRNKLDNVTRKPKGITLDNGLKKGNKLKARGAGRKIGGAKRKRRK